ncbi:MAG: energy transducer TonB [Terriglobales bacterium]
MNRVAVALVASLVLGPTVLSQNVACGPPSVPQSGKPEAQSPSTATTKQKSSALVLKPCSDKTPPPCAQVPPHLLKNSAPKYSKEARKARVEGTAVLSLVVGADGLPRDISVRHPLGFGLDEEAIKAIKKWRFKPATMDGNAVAVEINVDVVFHLY